MGKKNKVIQSNFSDYERLLDAARRAASIECIFVRIPDLTFFFAFTGGICLYRDGFYYQGLHLVTNRQDAI